ncbi:Hypothetical protein D9617_4g000580 [Elsinoe fawcettii]|nr:Hypothetical protein D9617_4g000580 [Elsinoe fawcettii]
MTVQHPTAVRRTTVTMPPSPPQSSTSPREVRFATSATSIPTGTRTLDAAEKASVFYFESHANGCRHCRDAYNRFKDGKFMCRMGATFIRDVGHHIKLSRGQIVAVRDGVFISMPSEFKHIEAALKLVDKRGPDAPFGVDNKKLLREAEGRGHHSSRKDKHKRVDSHSTKDYTQEKYAAAQAFYGGQQYTVQNMSPASSRTSSTESRRPRSFELDQAYAPRSDSVAATIGSRAQAAYDTKNYRPSSSRHKSSRK